MMEDTKILATAGYHAPVMGTDELELEMSAYHERRDALETAALEFLGQRIARLQERIGDAIGRTYHFLTRARDARVTGRDAERIPRTPMANLTHAARARLHVAELIREEATLLAEYATLEAKSDRACRNHLVARTITA